MDGPELVAHVWDARYPSKYASARTGPRTTIGSASARTLTLFEMRSGSPALYQRFERATADLDPPFALVDLGAFDANAADMVRRAAGKPIRLATKSVRCRVLQNRVLGREGFRGVLAFTLPEALWLAGHGYDDIVVGYPTVDRGALATLAKRIKDDPGTRITLMVDSSDHLDLIEKTMAAVPSPIRVCLDVDAGWWPAGDKVRIGAKRSPVHSTDDAVALARSIVGRKAFRLVGIMAYEGQIAGVGDAPPRRPLRGMAVRAMQKRSAAELAERRARVVEAVSAVAALEFVNGGGTGSLELTSAEESVTEIAAGSGLYGPALFDAYRRFSPRPAALFCLPVVRRPSPRIATVLGGGYLASGPGDKARLPVPYLPSGLRFDSQEGAGEVQTPLLGPGAARLQTGDRVYFRHAKAGEMCERFERLYLVAGDEIAEVVPTYRGEGRCFL